MVLAQGQAASRVARLMRLAEHDAHGDEVHTRPEGLLQEGVEVHVSGQRRGLAELDQDVHVSVARRLVSGHRGENGARDDAQPFEVGSSHSLQAPILA